MALNKFSQSRRDFLKASAGIAGGIGVLAFPAGLDRVFADVSPGVQRLTDVYPEVVVGNASYLLEGELKEFGSIPEGINSFRYLDTQEEYRDSLRQRPD